MDDRHGNFNMLTNKEASRLKKEKPDRDDIFRVGETITIQSSVFKISKIWPNGKMMLKLLPAVIDENKKEDNQQELSVEEIKDTFVEMIDTCGD